MIIMIKEYRNVTWQWNYLGNYKEGDDTKRLMMIQENRNVIGNEIILVITKKATTNARCIEVPL